MYNKKAIKIISNLNENGFGKEWNGIIKNDENEFEKKYCLKGWILYYYSIAPSVNKYIFI